MYKVEWVEYNERDTETYVLGDGTRKMTETGKMEIKIYYMFNCRDKDDCRFRLLVENQKSVHCCHNLDAGGHGSLNSVIWF